MCRLLTVGEEFSLINSRSTLPEGSDKRRFTPLDTVLAQGLQDVLVPKVVHEEGDERAHQRSHDGCREKRHASDPDAGCRGDTASLDREMLTTDGVCQSFPSPLRGGPDRVRDRTTPARGESHDENCGEKSTHKATPEGGRS